MRARAVPFLSADLAVGRSPRNSTVRLLFSLSCNHSRPRPKLERETAAPPARQTGQRCCARRVLVGTGGALVGRVLGELLKRAAAPLLRCPRCPGHGIRREAELLQPFLQRRSSAGPPDPLVSLSSTSTMGYSKLSEGTGWPGGGMIWRKRRPSRTPQRCWS
jgi:hypothetical protein